MAYFTTIFTKPLIQPTIVVCDSCLMPEEFDYIYLPPYRPEEPPEMEQCVIRQQKDPWCWAPRWSMTPTPCDRCGETVDPEPMSGWEVPAEADRFGTWPGPKHVAA